MTHPTAPVHPMEEKGEVSDQEVSIAEQELDQQLPEEQNYRETVTVVSSLLWDGTRFWNSWVQPHPKIITPLPVLGPSQRAKYE